MKWFVEDCWIFVYSCSSFGYEIDGLLDLFVGVVLWGRKVGVMLVLYIVELEIFNMRNGYVFVICLV